MSSKPKTERDLDKVYSEYIRKKYADNDGMVDCVTCGYTYHWKYIQNGHFHSRRYTSLRFYEKNTHPQCYRCNIILSGNIEKYKQFILSTYGANDYNYMMFLRDDWVRNPKKYTPDYDVLFTVYSEQLSYLKHIL